MMQAFSTRGKRIDAVQQIELPVPSPGPRQVLAWMATVAPNFRDLLVVNGVDGWTPAVARLPLSDGVGASAAAGAEVTRFQLGDRVSEIFLPKWLDGGLNAET